MFFSNLQAKSLSRRRLFCAVLLPAITLTTAVPSLAAESAKSASSASEAFDYAANTLFQDIMDSSPINLHYSFSFPEDYEPSDQPPLGTFSESFTETEEILNRAKENLAAVDFNSLTAKQKQVYRMIDHYADINLGYCSLPDYTNTLGPMGGILSSLNITITEYYLLSEQDIEGYISVLKDIPRFLENVVKEIEYQEGIGYAPSLYAYEQALENKDAMTTLENHPYLEAFESNVTETGLSDDMVANYTEQVKTVLTNEVLPAFSSFYQTLETKKASAGESKGLAFYDQGKEYYELLVKDNTGTDMTPLELKDYLTDKLTEGLMTLSESYSRNPNLLNELNSLTAPETDADAVLESSKEKVAECMPDIGDTTYTLSYLPEALQIPNNLAYYLSSPIDNTARNIIRINPSEVGDDSMLLWTTMAHEGYPGHLYQHQYFMQNSFEYDIETLIGSLGTSEGWAYYVEKLSLEWAGVDETVADAYFTKQVMGMAIIAVADIGVNYEGWGLNETSDFLSTYYGRVDNDTCQNIIDTCANDPGTYLPYSVGCYQTEDLFEQIADNYFSDKDMYAAYLKLGSLPFTLLEKYLITDGFI